MSWRGLRKYIKCCCQTSTKIHEHADVIEREEEVTLRPEERKYFS